MQNRRGAVPTDYRDLQDAGGILRGLNLQKAVGTAEYTEHTENEKVTKINPFTSRSE